MFTCFLHILYDNLACLQYAVMFKDTSVLNIFFNDIANLMDPEIKNRVWLDSI